MFDSAYFCGLFADRVREFSHENEGGRLQVHVVTPNGERHDALQLRAGLTGGVIRTRDERMIFVPYTHIEYVEVTILRDQRIPGFELLVDS